MTLYIAGAGGFGRETLDALVALGLDGDVVFCDDDLKGGEIRGRPVVDPEGLSGRAAFVVGVANPRARRTFVARLCKQGLTPRAAVMHPRAIVGPETVVGSGGVVLGGAHISSNCSLGDHVQVNYNATVGHDAVLNDHSTIYPGANVGGSVHIGFDATVGANACVLQERTVGDGSFVGAGAVVTKDVPPATVMVGVPARPQQGD